MRRARAAALPIVHPDLVEFYLAHRAAQGMNTDHKVRWGARALLAAVPDLSDFCRLPLERQLVFNHETHRFISWLSVTGRLQPGADYLVARRPRLGIVLARTEPELHLRFMETARSLGFRDALAMTQFNLLGHFVALFGKQPHELQQSDWDEGRRLLLEAARRIPNRGVKALSTALFNLEATLFHCELTDQLPRRRSPDRADMRAREWSRVPAGMADTMQHYLRQIAGTMRPGTVKNAELTLREFALLVAAEDTDVTCVAELKRVPVGKMHTDRYVPLHPQLKTLLDDWLLHRPEGLRSNLLFTDHGRPVNASRIEAAVRKAAQQAGLGRVTPHQLRHTLATQAINRGMSLEAIAALLGHRSLSMTRVYARIADRTVADEYFAVSEKVEALYDAPRQLPADAEGTEMAKLRREMHRRMLGNGYCARPVEMDCHFESICESCTFFVTTIEFRPTLERQRDDATAKGQVARERIFDGLLSRLDGEAS
ncbi:site-specific integrase [Streptomyces sp. NBC_00117]|uniref:tyrosine-type recombinase/integrase n=1 Tax=unclassified Streptomyces TaxID=2593676 RepID=UPI003254F8AA